jgi:hypothetical protein
MFVQFPDKSRGNNAFHAHFPVHLPFESNCYASLPGINGDAASDDYWDVCIMNVRKAFKAHFYSGTQICY